MDAVTLLAESQLTEVWLPLLVGFVALGGLVFGAMRYRPEGESRLYADAMRMVAELKEQLAEARKEIEHMQEALSTERDERRDAERRIVQLYARIDALEAKLGGRRAED